MREKTTGTKVIIAVAVIMAVVFLLVRSIAPEAVYPVEKARRTFSEKVFGRIAGAWHGAQARAENASLRRQVESFKMMELEYTELLTRYGKLRESVEFSRQLPGGWIMAEVISSGGAAVSTRRTIRVAKGSLAGVSRNAVVRAPEGLVGKVVAVTPHTSEVLLITDPSLKVACRIEGRDNVGGIVSARADGRLSVRYYHDTADLPPRANVVTSGRGGVFPAGIPVGALLGDTESPASETREDLVTAAVDVHSLEEVFIRREE